MEFNTVLFIGKPGSGKGTQASLLKEKTGWDIYASGDMFRAINKEDSFIGRMKAEHEQGILAPQWFATYLFQKTIFSVPHETGVIFDGFGRKVPEAKLVIEILNWLERPFRAVHIKVSDEKIIERLTKRRGEADRADDHSIEKRLEEYREYTEPSIEVFREAGMLVEVAGDTGVDEVAKAIQDALHLT
jgi:adenylate kinase